METVISKDGTLIAYDRKGNGPAVILVDGAFGHRAFGPNVDLKDHLAKHFTVYNYDRRGRGDSGDTQPYAPMREVEDIASLIEAAGGSAYLYGISSGAGLALEAAKCGLNINKLAIYEAPFIVDNTRDPLPSNYLNDMKDMIAKDQRGAAVRLFMTKGVGVPAIFVFMMRFMSSWKQMTSIANTVVYDSLIVEKDQRGKPFDKAQWSSIIMPTKVIAGSKSPAWMQNGMKMLADVLPNATHYTLEGEMHIVNAAVLAPAVIDFFKN